MDVLRTPDDRFEALHEYPFEPHYAEVSDPDGGALRMHYVDEGPRDAPPVLMFHGNPEWSYGFRRLISRLAAEGFRAIAPDMIGFGRSDKPVERREHSIARHVGWLRELVQRLDLREITLICQDWGGTMGPGVVALEEQRFARILISNGIMHTAEAELAGRLPRGYSVHTLNEHEMCIGTDMLAWLARSQRMEGLTASQAAHGLCTEPVSEDVAAGYDAPFPDERHMVALRQFAMLIPLRLEDEGAVHNRETWKRLSSFRKPVLTVYGDADPTTGGWDAIYQERIPGARGQPHVVLEGAGHFLAEDRPEELAERALGFIRQSQAT